MNHFVMLQRNLVYTGITRAKKILVLVGTKKALGYAVRNVTVSKRNTMLKDRLQRAQTKPVTVPDQPAPLQVVAEPQAPYGQTHTGTVSSAPAAEIEKISHEEWLKRDLFVRLGQSKFRSRFRLTEADREYVRGKGMETIRDHASQIVRRRLSDAEPKNDGKQTPMRGAPQGHPVFIGQHATGTCCRGCLEKWHGIPKGRPLSEEEQNHIVDVLMQWIERQMQG